MVCARLRAIMHSLTLVHYRYVHVHNHGISKTYTTYRQVLLHVRVCQQCKLNPRDSRGSTSLPNEVSAAHYSNQGLETLSADRGLDKRLGLPLYYLMIFRNKIQST